MKKKDRARRMRIIAYSLLGAFVVGSTVALAYQDNIAQYVQLLANPDARYIHITEGLRKEQIAERFAKTLNWDTGDVNDFLSYRSDVAKDFNLRDGDRFPQTYIVPKNTDGYQAAEIMYEAFKYNVLDEYFDSQNKNVKDIATVLKIASIIEREAAGKSDMRLISGILWNRIFKGMKLQADATVQYAKGTAENKWWPQVTGADVRGINSLYNTYRIVGLPPSPISNPGIAAIEAALNPEKTNCLFYIHDKWRRIHCSTNYKQHEQYIKTYLK